VQQFVATDPTQAQTHFPATGIELRLLDSAGTVIHQHEFRDVGAFTQIETRAIRKRDGTALFLFIMPVGSGFQPPGGMRVALTFSRNLGPDSPAPILRQAGSDTAEVAVLDFALG